MADELTGYDLQVLNLAMLRRSEIDFDDNSMWVDGLGLFQRDAAGLLQHVNKVRSKWSRRLSLEGQRRLTAQLDDMLQAPIDFDAKLIEERARYENAVVVGDLTVQSINQQAAGVARAIDRQVLQDWKNRLTADQLDALKYRASASNPPMMKFDLGEEKDGK